MDEDRDVGVDLYWLALGAGGHSVRLNGRVFEALVVHAPQGTFVVEMTPIP